MGKIKKQGETQHIIAILLSEHINMRNVIFGFQN